MKTAATPIKALKTHGDTFIATREAEKTTAPGHRSRGGLSAALSVLRVGAAHGLPWASEGPNINASGHLRDDMNRRYFSKRVTGAASYV